MPIAKRINAMILAAFIVVSVVSNALAERPKYVALLIANQDYRHWPDLQTPHSDVRELAILLQKKYGFEIPERNILQDVGRGEIVTRLAELSDELGEDDRLLIYYAGHGHLSRDNGYWIGVDAKQTLDGEWLSDAVLRIHTRNVQSKHVMIVADSCYSAALLRAQPNEVSDLPITSNRKVVLAKLNGLRTRTALTSGGVKPVVDRVGASSHSIFAEVLLTKLRNNDDILLGRELFSQVEEPVAGRAKGILGIDQVPRYGPVHGAKHDGGDFIFLPKGKSLGALPMSRVATDHALALRGATEKDFWDFVKDTGNPILFEKFLRLFPGGEFAPAAKLYLRGTNLRDNVPDQRSIAVRRELVPVPSHIHEDRYVRCTMPGEKDAVIAKAIICRKMNGRMQASEIETLVFIPASSRDNWVSCLLPGEAERIYIKALRCGSEGGKIVSDGGYTEVPIFDDSRYVDCYLPDQLNTVTTTGRLCLHQEGTMLRLSGGVN